MSNLIPVIVAAIIGIVLKPVGEYFVALMQFNFIGFRVRNLSGDWKSSWSFADSDKSESHGDLIKMHQTGPFIRGDAKGEKHRYIVKGRLNSDGFIQGTWRDLQDSTDWYGSFKLKVYPDGKKMVGKWIGNSSIGVRSGDWIWERC